MRHTMLALFILLLCLGFCLFSMLQIRAVCQKTLLLLSLAQQAGEQNDFSAAAQALARAERCWKGSERFFGLSLTHEAIDDILTRFAALSQYASLSDRDDFLAGCAELSCAISHIRQMELPSYENIL